MTVNSKKDDGASTDIAQWRPWPEPFAWDSRFNQLLDAMWRPGGPPGFTPGDHFEETDDAFVVELDLPGVAKKDITVDVAGRRVAIHGQRVEKERKGLLRHTTRVTGQFSYELTLPTPVDETAVKASLTGGVLSVHLPKEHAAKATRIAIE